MYEKIIIIISMAFIGLIEIIVAIPMLKEKIKPNIWYGFKTTKTLSDPEIWYKANKYAARELIISGILLLITSSILYIFKNMICFNFFSIISLIILTISIILMTLRSFRYLKKL